MNSLGFKFPVQERKTALYDLEENWYLPLLAQKYGLPLQSIKRNNFGQYSMAVNYLTTVLEEASAINKVAVYNIDHMGQLLFYGTDVVNLLNRALAGNFNDMKVGQCKYTLLLNKAGGVQDDMILMRLSETSFILVINAGHDITDVVEIDGSPKEFIADIDRIMACKNDGEEVWAKDISETLVKIDIQGPLSYKLIKEVYGESVLKNRYNPDKNMNYFTFNEFEHNGNKYYLSRTGYTNRWGWELYIPSVVAEEDAKIIITKALNLGGLLVGLGGRDENRISAGPFGLPLMGQEYDPYHTPVNAPLFETAVDMNKDNFTGKETLAKEIAAGIPKRLYIFVSEGIVTNRGIYKDGKRLGTVTSSINSPNVSLEMRLAVGSKRKNVNEENGTAAIGMGWFYHPLFPKDAEGKEIGEMDNKPIRIPVEFYREDENRQPKGSPVIGYVTLEGITLATAHKPLKNIENL